MSSPQCVSSPPRPPAAAAAAAMPPLTNSNSCAELSTSKALHINLEDNPNQLVYQRMEAIIKKMQKEETGLEMASTINVI